MSQELLDVTQFTPPLIGYRRGDSVFLNGERYVFVSDTKVARDRRNRHQRRKDARQGLTGETE